MKYVLCTGCGKVVLTQEDYNKQLDNACVPWYCPQCGKRALLIEDSNNA